MDCFHDWCEALADLGVMGLVPGPGSAGRTAPADRPAPREKAGVGQDPSPKPGPTRTARPAGSVGSAGKPAPAAAKAAQAWTPPADPAANPPQAAIDGCGCLADLRSLMSKCGACPLGAGRIKPVFGEGNPRARLMFVGEGPGRDEDIQGRPFVGRAGALLDKMIAALGMARHDVYIANVVKCRPEDNRTPTSMESQTCLRSLRRQIELISPAVLVGLGATPLREMLGVTEGITKVRGKWHTASVAGREIPFMPTFHPAYVLRQYTEQVRRAVWDDLRSAAGRC